MVLIVTPSYLCLSITPVVNRFTDEITREMQGWVMGWEDGLLIGNCVPDSTCTIFVYQIAKVALFIDSEKVVVNGTP